jgi:hypothetical protein
LRSFLTAYPTPTLDTEKNTNEQGFLLESSTTFDAEGCAFPSGTIETHGYKTDGTAKGRDRNDP